MSTLNVAINASGAKAGADSFNRSIDKMGRSVDKFSKDAPRKMKATFASITRHAKTMTKVGAGLFAGMIASSGLLLKSLITTGNEFSRMKAALVTLEGGLAAGTAKWQALIRFAEKTPFMINEVVNSYKLLKAYGLDPTLKVMTALGDAAAILGNDVFPRVSRALGQISATGKVTLQDLNQLTEAGIDINVALKDAFGIGRAEVGKLNAAIIAGVVSMGDVQRAFITYMEDKFGGAMARLMTTMEGQWMELKSKWEVFKDSIMTSGLELYLTGMLKGFNDQIDRLKKEGRLDEWADKISDAFIKGFSAILRVGAATADIIVTIKDNINNMVDFYNSIPVGMKRQGLIRLILFGPENVEKMIADTKKIQEEYQEILDKLDISNNLYDNTNTEYLIRLRDLYRVQHADVLKLGEAEKELNRIRDDSAKKAGTYAADAENIIKWLEGLAAAAKETTEEIRGKGKIDVSNLIDPEALEKYNQILSKISRDELPEFEQGLQDIETKYDDLIDAVKEYGDAAGKEFKEIADAVDKLESLKGNKLADYAKDATKATDDLLESISSLDFEGMSFGNEIADGINNAVISMNALIDVSDSYVDKLEELAEQKKKGIDVTEAQATLEQNYIKAQVSGYRQLFGTMSQLFDEGSKEREAMHKAEMAFAAIELAMSIKQMAMDVIKTVQAVTSSNTRTTALAGEAVMSATAGIAGQATGDPYTAFPRIAAMIALMGAVLAMGGISFGGGGGSSGGGGGGSSPTTGTVLGDPTKSSESLKNSLDMMEDYHAEDYKELVGIHNELKSLNNNISGLVSNIVRNFGDFDASQYEGSWIRESGKKFESWVEAGPGRLFIDKFTKSIVSWSTGLINKGLEVFFGGEKEVKSYGAELGRTDTSTVEDVLAGQMPSVEAYYYWKQKGGLTGSTKRGTEHEEVDEGVSRFFGKLYEDISNVLVYLGEGFGYTAEQMAEVFAYEFAHVQLDLKGLTGAEIEEKIQAWISTTGDEAVEELFGEIVAKYQKLDEGMLEAAVRLIAQKVIVLSLLESINMELGPFGVSLKQIKRGAEGTTVSAIDFTQALIAVAGDFEDLIASISNYYDKFFTEEEKHADLTENLTTALADQNLVLPGTREGFRELVEGLDLTTEEGKEAFIVLMEAAEVADAYYSTIEKITESIKAITDAHDTYGQSLTETLSAKYGLDLSQYTYEDWHRFVESLGDLSQYSEEFRQDLLDLGMAYEDQYEALVDNIMGITGTTQAMLDNGTACENLVGYLNGLEAAMLEAGFTIEDVAATINAAMVIVIGSIADIYREMAYGRPATLAETIASHYEGVSASDIKGIDKAAWQGFVEDMVAAWEASESREDYGAWAEETYGAQFVADMEAWGRHLLVVVDDALTKSIRAIGVAYTDLERGRPATLAEEIASHYEGISASEIEGIDKEGWQGVVDEIIAAWEAAGSPEDYTTWAREQYGDQFFADMEAWGNHLMDEAEKAVDEAAKAAAAFVEAMAGAIDFATTSMGWREMAPHAKSTSEQYTEQYKHIQDLWAAYTGTTVQAAVLSSAFGALSGLSYDLASEIRNAIVSINESYTSALASMYMETLTPQGKYDYYREEIRQMYAGMADITDPVKLKQYMDDILQYSTTAYGMLDEDQKKQYYGEYEAFLTKVQTEGTERLEALGDALDTANEALAAAAIAIQNASDRQLTAADLQLIAAQGQQAAADTPITVHVESGGGEVG